MLTRDEKKDFLLSIAFFAIWIYLTIQTILSKYWDTLAFAVFVLTVSIVLAYIKNKFVSRIIRGILVLYVVTRIYRNGIFNSKTMPGKRLTTKISVNNPLLLFSALLTGYSPMILLKRWDVLVMGIVLVAWLACPAIVKNKIVLRIIRGTFIVLITTIIIWRDEIFS